MTPASLASAVFLVSFYKPLLIFVTFLPWLWLVSSKLEKDARRLRLNYRMFDAVFLASGVAALAVMLLVPVFWIGWPLGIILLGTPVYVYWQIRNREVPESAQFRLSGLGLGKKLFSARPVKGAKAAVRFVDPRDQEHAAPPKDDPSYAVHMLAEDLIVPALEARASRLDVAVGSRGTSVTQLIDGVRYKRDPVAADAAMSLIDYLKEVGGLNVEDRRRRQTSQFRMEGPQGRVELTLVTAGSSSGQEARLIFDRRKRVLMPIDGLGLLPGQLESIRTFEAEHERHGIFLFGAPSGQGLTTTAYALVGRHDAYTSNVKTLEREVEAEMDGVDHVRWDPTNPDVDYPTNLQSIIRRDPDVVLVAELRDAETARIVAEPIDEGPLIYVPQRQPTVVDQIREWAKLVGDVKTAVKPLRVVMNQRLLRRVCPHCRQPYTPSADQLRKLNLPADKVSELYQASGKVQVKNKIETCQVCQGTGYFGLTGVFQVMVVSDQVRQMLRSGDVKGALAEARRNKMIYLQEAALRKVVDGDTTIDEVVRVTAPAKTSAPASRPPANPAAAT